nr:hypothetical protein [Fodinicola feengrottensis]
MTHCSRPRSSLFSNAFPDTGGSALPALENILAGRVPIPRHHLAHHVVDGDGTRHRVAEHRGTGLQEPAAGAGQRQLVGLRQVQDDIGHRPAHTPGRCGPAFVVQRGEKAGQLVVLRAQRVDDSREIGVHKTYFPAVRAARARTPALPVRSTSRAAAIRWGGSAAR